ncbi:Cullin [Absidia repens]|uniref:Cullin n=1 Tax=Absidia repens TaxID=90262 RepID=A0A1X2IW83_9FUNG|nr:Cullin [Absidia repens]
MTSTSATPLPFSTVLTNLGRQTKNHQLSDKKFIVYDLKVASPSFPEEYEVEAWKRLQSAIYEIQNSQQPSESLETLYQICENLCQQELSQKLYENLKTTCKNYIGKLFVELERYVKKREHSTVYLETIYSLWETYSNQMNQIRCIFLYLDRSYRSVLELAHEIFCSFYQQSPIIREKVTSSILNMISSERNGDRIDSLLLKNCLRMLMDLNLYHSEFEHRFLDQTRTFYKSQGDRLVQEMHMSGYLHYVATQVHQESTVRVKQYFDKSSKAAINTIVEDQLLSNRVQVILDKCFSYFMDNRREDDLSLLYRLLEKVDKLDICAKYFIDYVKTKGSAILKDHIMDKDLFATLLSFIRKVDTIVRHSFEEDDQFVNGCKDSISYFINLRQNNATKLLANYTDFVLRNDKIDEKSLDTCMTFFKILQSKDAFEVLYKQDLAKRLILEVGSNKFEKAMLTKMKKDSGPAYTSKLEKMLRDIKSSSELMAEFKFQTSQNEYKNFYTNKYPKRRLKWQNALSVCEVESNYPKVCSTLE